jgi:hypothetical protein
MRYLPICTSWVMYLMGIDIDMELDTNMHVLCAASKTASISCRLYKNNTAPAYARHTHTLTPKTPCTQKAAQIAKSKTYIHYIKPHTRG